MQLVCSVKPYLWCCDSEPYDEGFCRSCRDLDLHFKAGVALVDDTDVEGLYESIDEQRKPHELHGGSVATLRVPISIVGRTPAKHKDRHR